MSKEIHCRDVGFDCDGVVTGETEQEVIQAAAAHAKEAHGVAELTPEIVTKVKGAIRDKV